MTKVPSVYHVTKELSVGWAKENAKAHPPLSGHQIFLVHGHDDRALYAAARFLEKLRQVVIILREEPKEGRTIIGSL